MSRLVAYLLDAVRHPHEKLTRGQHQVRYAWDLAVHCYRQLMRHRAEGMAAELTYRTIFSLIPVVVLGLVMFRIVGGLEDVRGQVEDQLYSFFIGVDEIPDDYLASEVDSDSGQEVADDAGDPDAAARDDDDSSSPPSIAKSDPTSGPELVPPDLASDAASAEPDMDSEAAASDESDVDASNDQAVALAREEAKQKAQANIRRTLP